MYVDGPPLCASSSGGVVDYLYAFSAVSFPFTLFSLVWPWRWWGGLSSCLGWALGQQGMTWPSWVSQGRNELMRSTRGWGSPFRQIAKSLIPKPRWNSIRQGCMTKGVLGFSMRTLDIGRPPVSISLTTACGALSWRTYLSLAEIRGGW